MDRTSRRRTCVHVASIITDRDGRPLRPRLLRPWCQDEAVALHAGTHNGIPCVLQMHREIRGPVIEALIEQGIFNARSVLIERTIHQWSAGGVLIPFEEVPPLISRSETSSCTEAPDPLEDHAKTAVILIDTVEVFHGSR